MFINYFILDITTKLYNLILYKRDALLPEPCRIIFLKNFPDLNIFNICVDDFLNLKKSILLYEDMFFIIIRGIIKKLFL